MLKSIDSKQVLLFFFAVGSFLFLSDSAYALTAPSTSSFLYDVYDIAVLKIVKGAPGFAVGVVAMVFGGYALLQAKIWQGFAALVGSGLMFSGDKLVTSLGAMVF